jgi:hypothetical protein
MTIRRRKSGLDGVSAVLPVRPARLAKPGLRGTMLRLAGAAVTVLAALPFLGAPAKANLQQWTNTKAGAGNALHRQTIQPGHYLQMAGHTDIPHSDSNPHGDHTDPWGNHVDVDSHTDTAHINYTQDDESDG